MTQLTNDGSLENYVKKNFTTLTWQQRTDILYYVVNDIASIHKIGISHRIINSRNILMYGDLINSQRVEPYFIFTVTMITFLIVNM